MLKQWVNRVKDWEHRMHRSYEKPIVTEADRARAIYYAKWIDHGFLRRFWTNFDMVAPGVYRSNHPSPKRISEFKAMGGKSVLNLRGGVNIPTSLLSEEAATRAGLVTRTVGMTARHAPEDYRILDLLDAFDTLPKPFLIHCKSGADRTGLAAAIYAFDYAGASEAEARKQLSFKYLHMRRSRTGILDDFLDAYFAAHRATGIRMREWVSTVYDIDALNRAAGR